MCQRCDDTGFLPHPGNAEVRIPCPCRYERESARLWVQAEIPDRFRNCTMESLEFPNEQFADVVLRIAKFASQYGRGGKPGLLLTGSTGVGKTHLAVACARQLVERRISVRFWDYQSLLGTLRKGFQPGGDNGPIWEQLDEVDVLLLDDLGAHRSTDWVDDFITDLITRRYNMAKGVLITTNLSVGQQGTLRDRIQDRAYSRLMEMCTVIPLSGEDYRLKKGRVQ